MYASIYRAMTTSMFLLFGVLLACDALKITKLQIPHFAYEHESAHFTCEYDTEGETFYSARWYRNQDDIYSAIMRCDQDGAVNIFHFSDLLVESNATYEQGSCNFHLKDMDRHSKGEYFCEVNLAAPTFDSISKSKYLEIQPYPMVYYNKEKE